MGNKELTRLTYLARGSEYDETNAKFSVAQAIEAILASPLGMLKKKAFFVQSGKMHFNVMNTFPTSQID